MFYKNARIFGSDFRFHTGAFEVRDGLFGKVLPENVPADAVDWWVHMFQCHSDTTGTL